MRSPSIPLWLPILLLGCAPAVCQGIDFVDLRRITEKRAQSKASGDDRLPELTGIEVAIYRYDSSILNICPEMSSIRLVFRAGASPTWAGVGVKLRIVEGDLPFRLPSHIVSIAGGVTGTHWFEAPDRPRRALKAELAATLVTRDGDVGPTRYFEVIDAARPAAYVWPPWMRNAVFFIRTYYPEYFRRPEGDAGP